VDGFVAVGGAAPSASEGLDFLVLLWAVCALLVTRFVLKLPLTIPSVTVSLIVVTLWWAAVQRWGLIPPAAMLTTGLWLLSMVLAARRPQG
jgi:hypothetical protein